MIIKHDKVGVLNPCDNNKMIVNKSSTKAHCCHFKSNYYTTEGFEDC